MRYCRTISRVPFPNENVIFIKLLIVIGITAIIDGMLLSVFSMERTMARRTKYVNNATRLGMNLILWLKQFDKYMSACHPALNYSKKGW